MKAKIISVLCAINILFLCGCNGYREADNGYIVTAIGFDGEDEISVSVEVVTAGGNELRSEPSSEILFGKGKSPMEAIFSLNSQISKNLVFEHCGAIIIGRNLSETHLEKVLKYGKDTKELNFAVDVFISENAGELLKNSKSVSVARGFDIASNLKETRSETGIDYQNKFYEIYMEYKEGNNYTLPFLSVKDERIIIDGQCVFNDNKEKAYLNNEEALLYSYIKNNNVGGRIYLGEEFADISNSRCYLKNDREYTVSLSVKQKSKKFSKLFEKRTEEMLKKLRADLDFKADKIKLKERDGV